jgi:hypothetical protein
MSVLHHDNLHNLNTLVKENANHLVVLDSSVCPSEPAVFLLLVSSSHMNVHLSTEKRKDVKEKKRENIVRERKNNLNRLITHRQLLSPPKRRNRNSVSVR